MQVLSLKNHANEEDKPLIQKGNDDMLTVLYGGSKRAIFFAVHLLVGLKHADLDIGGLSQTKY